MPAARIARIACPACGEQIEAPFRFHDLPVHPVGSLLVRVEIDVEPVREHMARHGGTPGGGRKTSTAEAA